MYSILAGLILAAGVVLFLAAPKLGKKNKAAVVSLRAIGAVLAICGVVALSLLLSGTVKLPLA